MDNYLSFLNISVVFALYAKKWLVFQSKTKFRIPNFCVAILICISNRMDENAIWENFALKTVQIALDELGCLMSIIKYAMSFLENRVHKNI